MSDEGAGLARLKDRITFEAKRDPEGLALVWKDEQGRVYTRPLSHHWALCRLHDDDWIVVCNESLEMEDLVGVFAEAGFYFLNSGRVSAT